MTMDFNNLDKSPESMKLFSIVVATLSNNKKDLEKFLADNSGFLSKFSGNDLSVIQANVSVYADNVKELLKDLKNLAAGDLDFVKGMDIDTLKEFTSELDTFKKYVSSGFKGIFKDLKINERKFTNIWEDTTEKVNNLIEDAKTATKDVVDTVKDSGVVQKTSAVLDSVKTSEVAQKTGEVVDKATQGVQQGMEEAAKEASGLLAKFGIKPLALKTFMRSVGVPSVAITGLTLLGMGMAGKGPLKMLAVSEKGKRKVAGVYKSKGKDNKANKFIQQADRIANKKIMKAEKQGNTAEVNKIKSRLGTTRTDFSFKKLNDRLDVVNFCLMEI